MNEQDQNLNTDNLNENINNNPQTSENVESFQNNQNMNVNQTNNQNTVENNSDVPTEKVLVATKEGMKADTLKSKKVKFK